MKTGAEIVKEVDGGISDGCPVFMFCKHDILKALSIRSKEILEMIKVIHGNEECDCWHSDERCGYNILIGKLKQEIEGEEK